MKKMSNKGFMLAETLIVSTFIMVILLFLYIQFNRVWDSYDETFTYDTVNSIYSATNIRDYVMTDGYATLVNKLGSKTHIDITKCNTEYFKNRNYCVRLFDNLNVKKVIFTHEDVTSLQSYVPSAASSDFSQTFKDYIVSLSSEKISGIYRIIVEFKDDTYANVNLVKRV